MNRIKLTLEGVEEEEDEEEDHPSPSSLHKMTTTLEISMISANGYKSRHSQPECGYALEPSKWTEYSIHTMDPDNLELTFEFFEVTPPDPTPWTIVAPKSSVNLLISLRLIECQCVQKYIYTSSQKFKTT